MSLGYKPSSIIGGPLDNSVIDQLSMRKEIVSKKSGRTDQDIMFLNGSTGWVKMTSSVDIDSPDQPGYSSETARKNVMLGGTVSNGKQRGGFNDSVDTAYRKSELLGYRPMAGITDFQVDTKNTFGTLRVATVNFKVNSVEELDDLEALFLRPGFSILLEWGHSQYYNNAGVFENTVMTFPDRFFNKMSSDDIHSQINIIKEQSSNNYDGMYGIIKNFIWSYNLDGGYDCRVDVVSKGELIESLSMVISPGSLGSTDKDSYFGEIKNKTTLHTFLNVIKNAETTKFYTEEEKPEELREDSIDTALKKKLPIIYSRVKKSLIDKKRPLHVIRAQLDGDVTQESGQWTRYITLSTLLELVNNIFTIKNTFGGVIKFYTGGKTFDKDGTVTPFVTFPNHFALDPQIAVLPKKKNGTSKEVARYYSISEQGQIPFTEDDLLNIYINVDYILKAADQVIESSSEKAKTVYDFITKVLSGVEGTLGGINEFDLHYEETQSTFYIIDRKVTPVKEALKESFIDLIGLSSTLENINLASKLSNNITSMMAIAAQAGDSNLGNDMLAVQTWQTGLQDRHNPKKDISTEKADAGNDNISKIDFDAQKRLHAFIKKLNTGNNIWYLKYNKEDIEGLGPTHKLLMVRYLKFETVEKKTSPPGLIPFELSFTMKGIGGIKIGQAFRVDDKFLPSRYRGNVAFLVTGVSHKMSSGRWLTDIKTQMTVINTPVGIELKKSEPLPPLPEPVDVPPVTNNPSPRKPIDSFTTSNTGMNLIKKYEDLRLNSYRDPGTGNQPFTVGYGTTRINGKPVQLGLTITEAQAEAYFKKDLVYFENEVKKYIRVDLTQSEFDALVSFTYNVGAGSLQSSTLRKKLNSKDYLAAADQFLAWNKAGGKVLNGLVKRRAKEKELFLTNSPGNP